MIDSGVDLAQFFQLDSVSPEQYENFADAAYTGDDSRRRFAALTDEYRRSGNADPLKLALADTILQNYQQALETFSKAPDNKTRRFYAGKAAAYLGRLEDAAREFERAAAKGWDEIEADMQRAVVLVRSGDVPAAEQLVKKHGRGGQDHGVWFFAQGVIHEERQRWDEAIEAYEKTLTLSPDHEEAMFRCARLYDYRGHEEQAVELYRRLAFQPRAAVNALLNLAVIFEDGGRYEEATECVNRVLTAFPNHRRARLFQKDIESSRQMVIDEVADKRAESRNRLLETPVTEFELSVRARNCLKKMRISTLGELLRLSEAELLAFKNFGETSLSEIKQVLGQRGLHLGMRAEEIDINQFTQTQAPKPAVPAGSEAILSKPVSEMELSVRARRCLQRLNVVTIGDLLQHTEAELLATRNFGMTSLNEIRSCLADMGLSLQAKR